MNFGTYESLIHGIQSSGNLKEGRKMLMPNKMNFVGQKLKKRSVKLLAFFRMVCVVQNFKIAITIGNIFGRT